MRLVLLVIVFVVAAVLLARAVRRLVGERRQGWRECAIRPSDGALPISTVQSWQNGAALPDAEGMLFRPAWPLGFHFPRRPARRISVESAVQLPGVHPSWRQVWSVFPGTGVARAATSEGLVELAALPRDLQDLVSYWRPPANPDPRGAAG